MKQSVSTSQRPPPPHPHSLRPPCNHPKPCYHPHHYQNHNGYHQAQNSHRNISRPPPTTTATTKTAYTPRLPPNFIIHLHLDKSITTSHKNPDINSLVSQCSSSPDRVVVNSGALAGSLHFREWTHTLSFVTRLWALRLSGVHSFTSRIHSKVLVPSDKVELDQNLKSLFVDHVNGLITGEEAQKLQSKLVQKNNEINEVQKLLKNRNRLAVCYELTERKQGLLKERDLVEQRLAEFKAAMSCILLYLEGVGQKEEKEEVGEKGVNVFMFDGEFDWGQIHRLVLREIRRLKDGLPIYAYRRDILKIIRDEQVVVLIGETGSGKSTQLVQFLADSGIAADGSILCTQPRKIAAISLAERVKEESCGCYKDNSVVSYPMYSSAQQFDSKVIYMTDNCLLQYYMNDRSLSGLSCVIIDEAHERSLNTDLLLALLKGLLMRRLELRLVIMSATANANQLSHYFFGCKIFHVVGRNFPVDIRYVSCGIEGTVSKSAIVPYAYEVVRMTEQVHKTEKEGTILAFLTSQMEVEWACENFEGPSAIALPLHGKLSFEEQFRIFQDYPGLRKVIFATNLAETSLTIPGVKYVVDSGMVKESKFEPGTGMNVLRVCRVSQSSAQQRAGRAGRTGPGVCFRLYTESDFELMPPNQEPEIRRVHLGIAVLRILALGVKNIEEFDFVDAPSPTAISMAIRNLVQLGAIVLNNNVYELTEEGRYLVKLGIEPRLGKLILGCFHHHLGREGLILAAVMANSSSIFCRVGDNDSKLKADCLKLQFCHPNGDLFTLLSVYKEWETMSRERRNTWCWNNSINAKSMRRCQDTVKELENCLQKELSVIIPTYWHWNPSKSTEHDRHLKEVILSAFVENAAMFSGSDQRGYQVALTQQHVQLHPSCSLLIFGKKPNWVVFGDLLSVSNPYLVCVTAFDFEALSTVYPRPPFDPCRIESQRLKMRVMTGFGSILLKRFCGKHNNNLLSLLSCVHSACMDERIVIEVHADRNEIQLFATSEQLGKVFDLVNEAVEFERKWLYNECIEKYLYQGAGASSAVALFGAGAQIKHLELEKRCLSVDVFQSNAKTISDRELLMLLDKKVSGSICAIHKLTDIGQEGDEEGKWGRITFLTPDDAKKAAQLNEIEFQSSTIRIVPAQNSCGSDNKKFPFPAVKAKVSWPRRCSKGFGILKCDTHHVDHIICDFSNLVIGGKYVRCEVSRKSADCIIIGGMDKELSETDVLDTLRNATKCRILDFFIVRGAAVENPPPGVCEEAILREISSFMPKRTPQISCCRVQVYTPEQKDAFTKALITFDGRLHLEAAKALEHLEGQALPGCSSWQKIKCQQLFHTSLSCSPPVYHAIKKQLDSLLASFSHIKGADCSLEKHENGAYRVKISANATRTVAELRRPLEEVLKGRTINHASLNPTIVQHLFSRNGMHLQRTLQRETGTYILFDKRTFNIRIFGPPDKVDVAENKLVQSLLNFHESKQLEIRLKGGHLPPDLMKEVVKKFGPDLNGLKDRVPGADFTLNIKNHLISVHGNKELKQRAEEIILEIAQTISDSLVERLDNEVDCRICFCELEDRYQLEGCGHLFCRACLVEQFESAIKNLDSFPVLCACEGCRSPILLADIRSLLSNEKLEELFRASLGSFVASSGGSYRFCPSPDCPSVYKVAGSGITGEPFVCGACFAETCTRCHLEYHPYLSCEMYQKFKEDPDLSLKEWRKGKQNVKSCPVCFYTIEKVDGCNHVECKCGRHICWVCLDYYNSSEDCYSHLRSIHNSIN